MITSLYTLLRCAPRSFLFMLRFRNGFIQSSEGNDSHQERNANAFRYVKSTVGLRLGCRLLFTDRKIEDSLRLEFLAGLEDRVGE